MPFYASIRDHVRDRTARHRAILALERLRGQLDQTVPVKDAESSLLLATWNIRDFGKQNRRGYGNRLPETLYYIAEVISRFDFVAVQEINDLDEWAKVMRILGRDWDYLCSDVTATELGGNGERLTYVFDRRKVSFQNIVGEIVLPANMLVSRSLVEPAAEEDKKIYAGKQFRRSPYIGFFQAGWFKFAVCTVHLYYGAESGEKLRERIEEIGAVARYFGERANRELKDDRALILLGDFNIVNPQHSTMKALLDNGFTVPKAISKPTNTLGNKYYDQIAFKTKPEVIEFVESKRNAGVIPLFETLMRDDEEDFHAWWPDAAATPNGRNKTATAERHDYYLDWRTYQVSDHNPLWCRIDINSSAAYIARLKAEVAD
jgi:endonuclease/exonuclease/phosphatase family metal-dependent hydrolase